MARLALGERIAGAFVGGFMGLFIGGAIMGALYVLDPGALRWRVLAAVAGYCAAFTFVVGEGLGDVIGGAMRLYTLKRGYTSYGDRETSLSTWLYSILLFLVWAGLLVAVVFAALR